MHHPVKQVRSWFGTLGMSIRTQPHRQIVIVKATWLTNYSIPRGAVTSIYLDFEGIYRYDEYYASTNPLYGGASDFSLSTFDLVCNEIFEHPVVQITPDVFPTPTDTPTLTLTPSITPTPSSTYTPTDTPTNTPTNTFTPTLITPTSAPNIAPQRNFYTTHTPILNWNQVTWATGYKIQISADQNFSPASTFTTSLPVGTLTYTTDSLANGTYYWRVMALGGTVSNWSIIGSFVISDPEPEVTP